VRLQVLYDVRVNALGNADYMFGGKTPAGTLLFEFFRRSLACGAGRGRLIACVYITAH
jgi:hypothetical protein